MTRRNALPYVVECKSSYPFFEAIAAFNVESVALAYAFDCAKTHPNFTYRVVAGKKVLATNVFGQWAAAYATPIHREGKMTKIRLLKLRRLLDLLYTPPFMLNDERDGPVDDYKRIRDFVAGKAAP